MQISKKLKTIGWIALLLISLVGIVIAAILSAGRSKAIKDLFFSIKNTFLERVAELTAKNEALEAADEILTSEEKRILEMIKNSPELVVPKDVDPDNPKAILKWFRELEEHYESK